MSGRATEIYYLYFWFGKRMREYSICVRKIKKIECVRANEMTKTVAVDKRRKGGGGEEEKGSVLLNFTQIRN